MRSPQYKSMCSDEQLLLCHLHLRQTLKVRQLLHRLSRTVFPKSIAWMIMRCAFSAELLLIHVTIWLILRCLGHTSLAAFAFPEGDKAANAGADTHIVGS